MSYHVKKSVWLIGPGNIGADYASVLSTLDVGLTVIGRSPKPEWVAPVQAGGVVEYLKRAKSSPDYAIVAVNERHLYSVSKSLLSAGTANILIEKPGALNQEDLIDLHEGHPNANIFIGYNRRFYQSVLKCKEFIDECDGPISAYFDFTEWTHSIDFNHYSKEELQHFVLCNSSHVLDTVFCLIGLPKTLHSHTCGGLSWHPSGSAFAGSGRTDRNILFSYSSNWSSAGRWGIEISLPNRKLVLRPLEELFIQEKGSTALDQVELPSIDYEYKAGLFKQTQSFLTHQRNLCTLKEHLKNFKQYCTIGGYPPQ